MRITDDNRCVGCGACTNICPRHAIVMKPDEEGFLHPDFDDARCVSCGLCQKVCPAETPWVNSDKKRAYALKHISKAKREQCTSGGAFVAISDWFLAQNGVVYGVVYNEQFCAVHVRAEAACDRDRMCGSKYVQSDTGYSFQQVREDLRAGRWVLYSGTSCQIDGLRHYLAYTNTDTVRLITCGLICHGVPSPMMWQEHLDNIRRRRKKEIIAYAHRSKVRGWHEHNECITFTDGSREYYSKLSQNHKDLFYGHYIIRPACSQCPYAQNPGSADITIADFWGCETLIPQIDDNRGVSLLLVNTEKGRIIEESLPDVQLWETEPEKALSHNHTKPCKPNPRRTEFWEDYRTRGYAYVCRKYVNDSFGGRLYYGGKKRLRAILVNIGILHV